MSNKTSVELNTEYVNELRAQIPQIVHHVIVSGGVDYPHDKVSSIELYFSVPMSEGNKKFIIPPIDYNGYEPGRLELMVADIKKRFEKPGNYTDAAQLAVARGARVTVGYDLIAHKHVRLVGRWHKITSRGVKKKLSQQIISEALAALGNPTPYEKYYLDERFEIRVWRIRPYHP